eukprot:191953_1
MIFKILTKISVKNVGYKRTMPIIFKKHFGDSDDDAAATPVNDKNDNTINSFLDETDDRDDGMMPPPSKKRKLNTQKSQPIQQQASKGSATKKTKSMLKRLRMKKRKAKNAPTTAKSNTKKGNTNTSSSTLTWMKPADQANQMQKVLMETLKATTKDLGFQFKASHFVEISRGHLDPIHNDTRSGSLDVLRTFLNGCYANIVNDDEQNTNDKKPKTEWIAYTKSMQIMIISPSVRKAVDTIKGIQNIKVKHSFVHKKQLEHMTAEEYEEYEQNKDNACAVIPLRICELFGKHRKIEYQEKELLNKSWHCGVGGINRINKLMASKHLTMKKCELIMIDLQTNAKNVSILEMKPICKELCQWLKQYAFTRISNKHTKIAFF